MMMKMFAKMNLFRRAKKVFCVLIAFVSVVPVAVADDPFDVEKNIPTIKRNDICATGVSDKKLYLPDVVHLALCRNPQTKSMYMSVMAVAAQYGQAKADYLPTVDLNAGVNQENTKVRHGDKTDSSSVSANVSLNWMLYDFGGRDASNEKVRQSLNAALMSRSDVLQSLIFNATEAYYLLFAAEEEYKNSQATLASALSAYEAAEKRYEVGLAALSDKLQAETSYTDAQLSVAKAEEAVALAKGNLAVLLNFAPDSELNLADVQTTVADLSIPETARELFKTAMENRADLLSKQAEIKKAEADIAYQKAQNAPSFAVSAGVSVADELSGGGPRSYGGKVGLSVNVPLFTGFKNQYKISQSRYEMEKSKADLADLQSSVKKEVWTSYQNFHTAKKTYEISLTALASAEQSAAVALGAYRAGRGSILNVLDAQSKLADVRTTKSKSFYAFLIAKSNILRKIGRIDPFNLKKGF